MSPTNGRNSFDWTFVNITLTQADAKRFAEWFNEYETSLFTILGDVVSDTYKLSLSYDYDNVCYIATLSATKNSSDNEKSSLSARSAEATEALGLVIYKHVVMCEAGNWQEHSQPANWG